MTLERLMLALTALALAACATDPSDRFIAGESSFVTGERYFRANMRTYPVTIMSVDGRDTTLKWVLVQPGQRVLRLQGAPPPGWRWGPDEFYTLEVQPCTRYWIVAFKPNETDNHFTPRIDHQEPLAGCTPAAAK
jgi:hypothetical protein